VTEQMDLYIGVVVSLMFLAGCFLVVISARERSEERRRQIVETLPPGDEKR
jgi:hypothetical protein